MQAHPRLRSFADDRTGRTLSTWMTYYLAQAALDERSDDRLRVASEELGVTLARATSGLTEIIQSPIPSEMAIEQDVRDDVEKYLHAQTIALDEWERVLSTAGSEDPEWLVRNGRTRTALELIESFDEERFASFSGEIDADLAHLPRLEAEVSNALAN